MGKTVYIEEEECIGCASGAHDPVHNNAVVLKTAIESYLREHL